MDNDEFDRAVVRAVFDQAALRGWREASLVEAALDTGLDLGRVRSRFPGRGTVLIRLGRQADAAGAGRRGQRRARPRERLFDMLMNRFEVLQLLPGRRHGAASPALPDRPGRPRCCWARRRCAACAGCSRRRACRSSGPVGALRVHGLLAAWLYALRAWQRDESADLSGTMAAVDRGLDRAMQAERSLPGRARPAAEPPPEPPAPSRRRRSRNRRP